MKRTTSLLSLVAAAGFAAAVFAQAPASPVQTAPKAAEHCPRDGGQPCDMAGAEACPMLSQGAQGAQGMQGHHAMMHGHMAAMHASMGGRQGMGGMHDKSAAAEPACPMHEGASKHQH